MLELKKMNFILTDFFSFPSCQKKGDLAMEALFEGIQNRGHDG